MASVPPAAPRPTNLARLPRLLADAQSLGLEGHLARPTRGIPTLALAVVWLVLAWRGTGRPHRLGLLDEPLLAALLGRARLPTAQALHRSLSYFSAKAVRAAAEAAYLAGLPRRAGRVWAALDAHQVPYWGRGKLDRFEKGRSGTHSRRLRGYRLYLAVDTATGRVITFVLARGRARDARLAAVFARRLRRLLGRRLAGLVADCGFTSRAAIAELPASGVPFIPGFARSKPIRARRAALSPRQWRWLRGGGAARLGPCPRDDRLRLFALGARSPTDKRGPRGLRHRPAHGRAAAAGRRLSAALAGRAGDRRIAQRDRPGSPGQLPAAPQPRRARLPPAGPQPGHRPPDRRRRRPPGHHPRRRWTPGSARTRGPRGSSAGPE